MLKKILLAYKFVSQQLLDCVKKGEPGNVFLQEREKLLMQMQELKCDPNEVKRIVEEMQILKIDEEIKIAYDINKSKIRKEIEKLNLNKEGNKVYSSLNYDSIFEGEA